MHQEGNMAKGKEKAKKAEKAKKSTETPVEASPQVLDGELLGPESQDRATQVREMIEGAVNNMTVAFYDLAVGLYEAYAKNYAQIWGYQNFEAYVTGRLDMKYRRAIYLVDCGKAIVEIGIDREKVQHIGWTKFKEISALIQKKPEEADRYLALAEGVSASQLKEELRKEVEIKQGREATAGVMRMSLKFEGDAMNVVADAIRIANGELGKEDVHASIGHICAEWLMAKSAVGTASSLDDWLLYLERTYGVRLQRVTSEESLESLLEGGEASAAEEASIESMLGGEEDDDVRKLLGVDV